MTLFLRVILKTRNNKGNEKTLETNYSSTIRKDLIVPYKYIISFLGEVLGDIIGASFNKLAHKQGREELYF